MGDREREREELLRKLEEMQGHQEEVLRRLEDRKREIKDQKREIEASISLKELGKVVAVAFALQHKNKGTKRPMNAIEPKQVNSTAQQKYRELQDVLEPSISLFELGKVVANAVSLRDKDKGTKRPMNATEPKQVNSTAQQKYRELQHELEQEKLTSAKLKQETREQAVQLQKEKLTSGKLKQETREQAVQLQKEKLTSAQLKQETREQAAQLQKEKLTSAKLKQEIREQAVQLQSYQVREASCLPRYKLEKRPRGMCVIINNVNFEDHGERGGAEFDEKALKRLFMDLLFTVHVFKDLQRNQMLNVAASFAKKDHSNFDALIFIVMSHGGNGDTIYGVRGRPVRMEDLMSEFKAANCPTLRNKPKLFFIQTCRGSLNETLSPALGDADANSAPAFAGDSTLPRGVCPQEADFVLAFATAPGYKAWRIPETGSPFIQTLVEAIREHHHNHHLLDILTEVNRRVVARENNQRVPVQVPAPTHTLRHQLYL